MRFLTVGDLHAQINNIEDTEVILRELVSISHNPEYAIDMVIFLGDLFHTHSVVRQEVAALLKKYIPMIKGRLQVKPHVLVGNHDQVGPTNASLNAISLCLGDSVSVVDKPTLIVDGIVAMPFVPDNEVFLRQCRDYQGHPILICHQTFESSQYENGFYAPGGIDASLIPQTYVVSGHIHKRQTIGKVLYVGTPRALTASDYNENKGVDILDFDEELLHLSTVKFISFNSLVKSYYRFDLSEESSSITPEAIFSLKEKDDVTFHVHGTKKYCDNAQEAIELLSIKSKVRIARDVKQQTQKQLSIESAGETVENALKKYVFEISEVSEDLREDVWKTIQNAMI